MAMDLTYHLKNNDLCIYFILVLGRGRRQGLQHLYSCVCTVSTQSSVINLGKYRIAIKEVHKTFCNEMTFITLLLAVRTIVDYGTK